MPKKDDAIAFDRSSDAQGPGDESPEQRMAGMQAELRRLSQRLQHTEEQLAQREAELNALFEQTPLLQGLLAPDGTLLRANNLAFVASGFKREQEIGRKFWDCGWWNASPDSRAFMQRAVASAAAGETIMEHVDYFSSDGSPRQADVGMSPVRDASGRVVLIYATGMDRTEEKRIGAELAAQEQHFRSLVAGIPGMVFRAESSPPWRVIYTSEGIERTTGYPVSYFIEDGHPYQSVMLEEDVERVATELAAQLAAGEPMHVEYRIRHRDRSVRWVEAYVHTQDDDPGIFEGTIFAIDERKRAEQALIESQENFRYTIQSVPSVLWTARPDGGLDFVSDASAELMGITPKLAIEQGWLGIVHPDDVPRVVARWQQSLESGDPYDTGFRMRDAQGEYHHFQVRAHARRGADGHILRWYGVATNVNELVWAEEQLRESEQRLRATIQASPGMLWTARADGSIDFMSEATHQFFGLTPALLEEQGWSALVHPEHLERVESAWRHAVETGEPYQNELPMRCADGEYRWTSIRATAVRDAQGRVVRWYGSGSNIHEFKQAQARAEDASRAKSAFLSTMSHEIRTPLNAVLGFASLLEDGELNTQQRDFVHTIRAGGDHLLGVINDILDFSKLESGNVSLEFSPCDLQETVEGALDLVAGQATVKNLELLYRIDPDVPRFCMADQGRLRQVLVNLLSNAVKFTSIGEVMVSVSAQPLGADDYEFEFRVSDTGIGIPLDRLGRLFRDFSQVDDSVARRYGGTGLGLAISKRLVEAHGGLISVESRPGAGSTFSFRLPAQSCAQPATAPATPTPTGEILRGRRLLLVDNNRSNLEILSQQAKAWGMDVVGLSDPAQAPELVRRSIENGQSFDLAILDQKMPGIDGLELTQRLHAVAPLPVVLLSSLGTTLSSARAVGAHIAAAQTKPVHRLTLFETLCRVLGAHPGQTPAKANDGVEMPRLNLLLVEDNVVNRKIAVLLLRKLGYDPVDIAVDGLEALEAIRNRDYDVVLMDVQMPNLDGLEATRRVRSEIDTARQPQIIAMTANAMAEDRDLCLAAGMDDYIAKPISHAQLTEALLRAAARMGVAAPAPEWTRSSPREDADARAHRVAEQVLAGGGEMGALVRSIDWSQTPLGPVYTWPQSLRTALMIVLTQKHPMFLWWGRELIQFYNDAYRPILGSLKHPAAMGQRGPDCWPELWESVSPLIQAATERGESSMVERGLLCPNRNGFREEGYYSYGLSPIRDESGGVGGVLVACSDHTAEVLSARRNTLLLDLDDSLAGMTPPAFDWKRVHNVLATARNDLPFVLVYGFDAGAHSARLLCAAGLNANAPAAPSVMNEADAIWPLWQARREPREHEHRRTDLPVLPPWPEAPERALVHPLGDWGALVVGLSPRLPPDEAYRRFIGRLALRLGSFGLA